MRLDRILESCLYAVDLDAAERFYAGVLGLERLSGVEGRHVFFRCGENMLLLFNPEQTGAVATAVDEGAIPLHGARGPGHLAFAISENDLPAWRARLAQAGVAIESEVQWPTGATSLYVRDPAGNSIELAPPSIWS